MKKFHKLGVIGRFKPLHNGGALLLETLCQSAEHVIIGIGSCNKYNRRNPFTAEETKDMLEAYLSLRFKNYELVFVPDYAHIPEYKDGQKWRQEAAKQFQGIDAFVTGNDWVAELLKKEYCIISPAGLIREEKRIVLHATLVRIEMARKGNWQKYVPEEIAKYIQEKGLDERFRKEFGRETLAKADNKDYTKPEDAWAERMHTIEV
jgi:cytidyltransferase-like protein